MTSRWIPAAAAAITAAALGAPTTALGVATNRIVISAPKTVKVTARYTIRTTVTFDARMSAPPGIYVTTQTWSHTGAAPCPAAAPFGQPGWKSVGFYTYIPKGTPADDAPVEFIRDSERLAKPGPVRYCGYVYLARYREVGAAPTYEVKARGSALTRARR